MLAVAMALLVVMIWWTFIGDRPNWLVIEDAHFFGGAAGLVLWFAGVWLRRSGVLRISKT